MYAAMHRLFTVLFVANAAVCAVAQVVAPPDPPVAPREEHVRTLHGDRFVDPYFWMRNREDPRVLAHLKAENAYAEAALAPHKGLVDRIYREMVGRIRETDMAVPVLRRGYWYYTRTVKGKQYPIYARRKGTMRAKEEILLDANRMAEGKPFFSVGDFEVSTNNRLLAYTTDVSGNRRYQLFIKDLATGRLLRAPGSSSDNWGQIDSFNWANDNRTFFTSVENAAKRPYRVYRRNLAGGSRLLFEEPVAQFNVWMSVTRDRELLLIGSASSETSEFRMIPLDRPQTAPRLIERRRTGLEYFPDHRDGVLYIRTNDGAPEYRVVTAPVDRPGRANWKPLLPPLANGTIADVDLFQNWMVVRQRRNAVSELVVTDLRNRRAHTIAFPESNYSVWLGETPDFNSNKLRVSYTSEITPSTVYDYDMERRRLNLLKRQAVPGYQASRYASEFVWATARDGTKIPVSIAYRRDLRGKRPQPMFLEAYGAYGAPMSPSFSSSQVSLWDRGVITATAYIRGGGELGERWHDAGKMARKINTFTDFVDVAQWLVSQGYTTHDRLGISGGSAGGLTMGAVMNLRPTLARVALVYVPFVDVINTMLDESLPLTTQEFLEWGNPKNPTQYWWLRQYSPYENVSSFDYPALLVRTGLNDSQVPYWEASKWVARIRELRSDKDPILFRTNLDAGHGGASGRYDSMRDLAADYAFLLRMLGI